MQFIQASKRNSILTMMLPAIVALSLIFGTHPTELFAGGGPNVGGAKLYIQQNELDQAINVLMKEVNEINPKNEDAWYLLGYIYGRQKKYDQMVEAFNKALEINSKFAEKGIKIGKDTGSQFHSEHGVKTIFKVSWANCFNDAVKSFNDAVNGSDEDAVKQSYETAVNGFRMCTQIQPDSSMAYRNWAAALMNAGRANESVEPLKMAIARNPKDADIKTMLSQVYMNNGQDDLAVPVLEGLWNQDGVRSAEVADLLARLYIRTGKKDQAMEIYKSAIAENADNFHFRYNYGTILLEAQDYDAAIEHLSKAYEIDPSSSDINYNLGAAYLNRGVSKREALPPDSEDKSYMKDFEAAFPYLEKTIKLNPDDSNTWFTLGRIAGQLNKIALAGYAFSKGEPNKSALDGNLRVGMPGETVIAILGQPDQKRNLESEQFNDVEEWVYKKRIAAKGKLALKEPINIYITGGRVDALMINQ